MLMELALKRSYNREIVLRSASNEGADSGQVVKERGDNLQTRTRKTTDRAIHHDVTMNNTQETEIPPIAERDVPVLWRETNPGLC